MPHVQFYRIAGSTLVEVVDPGERPAPRAGQGTEARGLREYVPGDPMNIVQWRYMALHSYADAPPMLVKTFDAEVGNVTTVAVDCSPSMQGLPEEGKLATAFGAAALLAWSAVSHGDPVEILLVGGSQRDPVRSTGLMRTAADYDREMEAIKALELQAFGQNDWRLLVDPHQGLVGRRRVVIIISDFYAFAHDIRAAVRTLQQFSRTVLAVRIESPFDKNPLPGDKDAEIYDIEEPGGPSARVAWDPEEYTDLLDAHRQEVAGCMSEEGVSLADIEAVPPGVKAAEARGIADALVRSGLLRER